MRPVVVVIADVFGHQSLEVSLVEDDDMIEQLPAAAADKAFGDPVLPRAAEASPLWFDAETPNRADNFLTEIRCSVKEQILGRVVVGNASRN
jgi:hypothetical protein